MGIHLCKECRQDDFHAVGSYAVGSYEVEEKQEDDLPVEKKGYLRKPKLQISQHTLKDDVAAENKHEKESIEVLRADETEMKPECYSMPPTDDLKLSVAISTTSISKEPRNEADDALDGFVDISDIGPSYVMPHFEELPENLLPIDTRERHTIAAVGFNYNDFKKSKKGSLFTTTAPSLYRSQSREKWNYGRLADEAEAIKRQMKRLESERISRLSRKNLAVSNNMRYSRGESQDLIGTTGDEYEAVDDANTGVSDSSQNSSDIDTIEQRTLEQIANSSDSELIMIPNTRESLLTGNIERVQQS